MCYRLAPYSKPSGKVNEKTRHISSLHFLVLFLACQTASPVKAKPSRQCSLHTKVPVCVCVWTFIVDLRGCMCGRVHLTMRP